MQFCPEMCIGAGFGLLVKRKMKYTSLQQSSLSIECPVKR